MALDLAGSRRSPRACRLKENEIDTLMDFPDEAPDATRAVGVQSELEVLAHALRELPQRRRSIFLAALVHKLPSPTIAKYYGVSVRAIDIEIQCALEHGASQKARLRERFDALLV